MLFHKKIVKLILIILFFFNSQYILAKNSYSDGISEQLNNEEISLQKSTLSNLDGINENAHIVNSLAKVESSQLDMSPLGMYTNAHWVVKVVIWILFVCSILTWLIFIIKFIQISISKYFLQKQQVWLVQQKDFLSVYKELRSKKSNIVLTRLINEINDELIKSNYSLDEDFKQRIDYRLDRQIQNFTQQIRYGISPLATIGSVAPFIGLFGTVWGIMNSFIGIVNAKTTSLSVVAPGIAEALFATALGLAAAIPAVVIYNIFIRSVNHYSVLISNLVAVLRLMVKRDISLSRLVSIDK
ncbi:tonB-system energizer ExbB [Avibacterium sp. 21-586]|uniref:tonB-system energizer ExbB n=1 Tax=Avibacterium sp. 21-586 TaxID=2911534 RepID=UPI002247D968|nr:tonB-system energizer ExbB [Avibacterium sp. 21-586]MCW9710289.1 tonB-system energizer ExbB [Avibacterium sp. 21-586]